MSGKVTKLHAVAPLTVSEVTRRSLIALLEDTLAEAKRGDISEVVILIQHADIKEWSDRSNFSTNLMAWVGRLEMTKLDLIDKYRELQSTTEEETK